MKRIPKIVKDTFNSYIVPRYLFIEMYQPSTEAMREHELNARNARSLATYKDKKLAGG